MHIVVPAQGKTIAGNYKDGGFPVLGTPWMTSFGLSETFSSLHLTIKALNNKGSTAYTITYSSGERETYLQDGLITDYVL